MTSDLRRRWLRPLLVTLFALLVGGMWWPADAVAPAVLGADSAPFAYTYDRPSQLVTVTQAASTAAPPMSQVSARSHDCDSAVTWSAAARDLAAEDGGGLVSELKGRISAARMGGSDSGAISLGGHEFSDDEIAQLTYQHIGEGDIPGRPSLDEISAALKNGQPVPLPGQNAVQYEYGGVRVIVNGDAPWRSTAYYPGK